MATKKDLVREVAECGISCKFARTVVDSLLDEIKSRLQAGEEVRVKNFGKFEINVHSGRQMVNPNTGEEHRVESRLVPHFTPAQKFRAEINEYFN
ncbi:MAG: HU family DNA-binding protein [bacterium]